jgi:cytosine permease
MRLLDYVAIYGLVLMPMGAVVLAEHRIFPLVGIPRYRTERMGRSVNWRAAVVWAGTLVACSLMPIHLFFRWLPGYLFALVLYTGLNLHFRKPAGT